MGSGGFITQVYLFLHRLEFSVIKRLKSRERENGEELEIASIDWAKVEQRNAALEGDVGLESFGGVVFVGFFGGGAIPMAYRSSGAKDQTPAIAAT